MQKRNIRDADLADGADRRADRRAGQSGKTGGTGAAKPSPTFERTPKDLLVGAALVLVGGIMWGTNATISKMLMGTYHADPLWIACVRELLAGAMFIAFAAVSPKQRPLLVGALRERRSYPQLIASALVCVLLVQVAYLCSINATNAGTATVLQSLNLLFVLAYVCLRGRRLPNMREGVGVALAFAGVVLLATGGDLSTLKLPPIGLFWGLVNAFATAAMAIMPIKLIARWGNMTVNGIMFVISGIVLLPIVRPWVTAPQLDWFGLLLMAYTVVIGTFGAFGLYLAGMMRVGSMRATMLGTSEPVAATVTSVAWTGEVFSPADFAGFAMILAMVFLVR
ncbi:membrane protein [Bifidobacterium biavatii DSM 23969]|uniref:Membrane protein n=2 Tax=Bifidobacterium biavatii TaxID=762212 RepID=A0A086ZNK6_9BIFI|nr:membrane protein [Bifidobacterium biavatii DSM 23969]